MAFDRKTPGVYVQEVSIFPPSITSVATAIPAFLGYTAKPAGTIARISSMNDYVANFGGPHKYVTVDVSSSTPTISYDTGKNFILYYAMQMYFLNGGGPCYVLSVGDYGSTPSAAHFSSQFANLALEDEPTLIVMPDITMLSLSDANVYAVYASALAQCNALQDRFSIFDLNPAANSPTLSDVTDFRSGIGTQFLKYGAGYFPSLVTSLSYPPGAIVFKDTISPAPLDTKTLEEVLLSTNATISDAWNGVEKAVNKAIGDALQTNPIILPPSSSVAGVYASVDRTRGVWKAPANVSLNGVVKPTITITNDDQEDLNIPNDGSGKSVNAIRAFTGKGILVWGARTLAGNDNEWRYVSVRRLFNMVEESVRKASEWVVFEPNDANLWLKVKTMVENYLTNLWKDGALAGATTKDAFFVKVGLNQTMTPQDILDGKLIIDIGMAAVRPAEFVILRFSHKMQES